MLWLPDQRLHGQVLTELDQVIRVARHYTAKYRPLYSACCHAETTLSGVATETSGIHWCNKCGESYEMTALVTREPQG